MTTFMTTFNHLLPVCQRSSYIQNFISDFGLKRIGVGPVFLQLYYVDYERLSVWLVVSSLVCVESQGKSYVSPKPGQV